MKEPSAEEELPNDNKVIAPGIAREAIRHIAEHALGLVCSGVEDGARTKIGAKKP